MASSRLPSPAAQSSPSAPDPSADGQSQHHPTKQELEDIDVEEKKPSSAYVIYQAISESADEELARPVVALAFSAFAAGLSMGFSLLAEALLRRHLPDANWTPLLAKLGYPVGFLIVILGRQQLFTENTLSPVLPLLRDRRLLTAVRVLRLWVIVLVFNFLGTFLFAQTIARTPVLDPDFQPILHSISDPLLDLPTSTAFLRSIFAGWLIALMVWLLPGAETGRIPIITLITYIIGLAHFNHIIAGSTEAFYLTATGAASWSTITTHFLLPTLAGNILGGVTLVAALNFGQAAKGEDPDAQNEPQRESRRDPQGLPQSHPPSDGTRR